MIQFRKPLVISSWVPVTHSDTCREAFTGVFTVDVDNELGKKIKITR